MGLRSSAGNPMNFDEFGRLLTTGGAGSTEGTAIAYTLLSNAAATGSAVEVAGGNYVWAIQGTWSGATATLQVLGPNGTDYQDVATATANAQAPVSIGDGSMMRVAISGGPPSAVYSNLTRVN